jgi:subtilisin-like proprotein convertase family protein
MRYQYLWRGVIICLSFIIIALLIGPTKSQPVSFAQPVEQLSLQREGANQEARGPKLNVQAQRDPIVTLPDAFGKIASLKDLPAMPIKASSVLARAEEPQLPRSSLSGLSGPDAVAQTWMGSINMPSPIANFDGISVADQGGGFSPPDTEGDIGYDPSTGKHYYFQWINVAYEAWDVTNPASPAVVVPLTSGNALWQNAMPGSACASSNDGDPIVLFDEQAHRWFISQFSVPGPYHECVAVSKTADPAGAWYVYDYPYRGGATYFNDYPHLGVWPDATYNAYMMTVHEFDTGGSYLGQSASAFDRAKLLAGDNSAPLVTFALGTNYYGMLTADLDGTPPAAGTPGFFFMTSPGGTLQIWEFKPNWTTPANSVFGVGAGHAANYSLSIAPYTDACDLGGCDRVPQSGTTQLLDSLGDRLMHRVAFRVLDGGIQTAVLNHTVDVDGSGGSNRTGIRWYEVRRDAVTGTWTVHQQSTYAPGTTDYRWMGSIATDQSGDIALGFSASSSSIFPSIRYVGRLFTDTLSTMPQSEITMTVGLGAQTGSDRWGDYSMMGVDPQDGCTFWYTQEYNGSTGSVPWKTRIGSFKFPTCGATATGNISGTVRNAANNAPINTARVTAVSSIGMPYPAMTNASGIYQILNLPTGTYTLTASATGFITSTIAGVNVTTGVTTTQNFALNPPQADLAITKTGPAYALPGATLVYTLGVINNGPMTVGPFTATYNIPDAITINDNAAATPYPITTTVSSGLPPVQKATVQLLGFSHTHPQDVDAILVGPTGSKSWLMSDPGSTSAVSNVNLTFDDAAASNVSCTSGPTSGTYKTTNCNDGSGTDIFSAPAPAGPYTASLAQFNGSDPTGTWGLYVRDDNASDSGSISGGWKLSLAGTYSLTVTDMLPTGVTYVGAGGNGWTCTQAGGVVTCTRPELAPGVAPNIVITATAPSTTGVITNTANITSDLSDNVPANNAAQTATTITNVLPVFGVDLSPGAASQSGVPGTNITYTLAVTNTGNINDTFSVAVSGNAFATNAPANIGPLAPGASTTFDVAVTIPLTATNGTSDTAVVTLTSQGDGVTSATSTLTTGTSFKLNLPLVFDQY